MEPTMTQLEANRELVALVMETERIRARLVALAQGRGLASQAEGSLWDAHDRIADVLTHLEFARAWNR